MSRDYAKRNSSCKKSRKGHLYLLIILLLAALITSLVMPDKYREFGNKLCQISFIQKMLGSKQQPALPKKIATKETITKTVTTAKFDFYNILPQKKDDKINNSETIYELAVATVVSFAAADHLKAELALLGFAASITPIYQNNIQKYHVSIGPYADKDSVLVNQKKLKTNGIKSELRKVGSR
jgi:hypothetical protein